MSKGLNQFGQPVGLALPDWREPPRPSGTVLEGRYCRIEKLGAEKHAESLWAAHQQAADGRDWTYLFFGPFENYDAFANFLRQSARSQDPFHFTVIDKASGQALGTAALMRIDPANGVLEVGHIVYSPALQRHRVGTEAMYLLMRLAFDELGYRRYEWKCDALNQRSRAAAERYGFRFEGLFRQAIIYKGRSRDTAWYSIIDQEWPQIRQAFQRWLALENF
ncbi:MAG TPA: GNAT family N-acetyltransferase, partial [Rhodospirillaceae bacterium]|nr:GNAT family N-acetyltransferase [Rhodospirillaceae bacterium]